MKIQKECFLLKDGRGAVMRSPEDADAEKMLKYLHDTARETDFLLRTRRKAADTVRKRNAHCLRN